MRPLILFIISFSPLYCFSQMNTDSLFFIKLKSKLIELNIKSQPSDSLPFNNILVLDARPDTTCIGFINSESIFKTFKLNFKKPITEQLREYALKSFKLSTADTACTLMIALKQFRLSKYVKSAIINNNITRWSSGVALNAELFLIKGSEYFALYKMDTLINANDESGTNENLIYNGFAAIFNKAKNKQLSSIHIGKTGFSYNEMQNHLLSFSNVPILNNTVLNEGVYINFNEFKTNNPSIKKI